MINKKFLFIFVSVFLFSIFGLLKLAMAADGSGTCNLSPIQVIENIDTTLTFTFTAEETMDGGSITIEVPGGWSAPQASSGTAGYTVATSTGTIGALSFSSQTITVPITGLANTQIITIVYGSGGGTSSTRVPSAVGRGGSYSISVSAKSGAGGALTAISSLPSIEVVARPEIDSTAPVTTLITPSDEEIIRTSNYIITGTAIDSGGSTPAWVKVGINDVWYEADVVGQSFSTWEYQWLDIFEGTYIIKTKSADWIGNNEVPGEGITITVNFEDEDEQIEDEESEQEQGASDEEIAETELIRELQLQIIALQEQIIEVLISLINLLQI